MQYVAVTIIEIRPFRNGWQVYEAPAEASALRKPDIDWEHRTITTFRHKTKSGFQIPLYPQLEDLLRRRCSRGGTDYVFAVKDAKKAISAACKRRVAALQSPLVPSHVHHARD